VSKFQDEKPGVPFKISFDWLENEEAGENAGFIVDKYFYLPQHDNSFPPLRRYRYLGKDLNSRRIIIKPQSRIGEFFWEQKICLVNFIQKLCDRYVKYY